MTDLDLEAIKARALAATPGPWFVDDYHILSATQKDFLGEPVATVWPDGDTAFTAHDAAHIAGMDPTTTLALAKEVEQLRERLTITEDMIERAADAIYRELSGKYGDFNYPTDAARAALEAALGEGE